MIVGADIQMKRTLRFLQIISSNTCSSSSASAFPALIWVAGTLRVALSLKVALLRVAGAGSSPLTSLEDSLVRLLESQEGDTGMERKAYPRLTTYG